MCDDPIIIPEDGTPVEIDLEVQDTGQYSEPTETTGGADDTPPTQH